MLDDKPDLSVSTFKAQLRVRSLGEPSTFLAKEDAFTPGSPKISQQTSTLTKNTLWKSGICSKNKKFLKLNEANKNT